MSYSFPSIQSYKQSYGSDTFTINLFTSESAIQREIQRYIDDGVITDLAAEQAKTKAFWDEEKKKTEPHERIVKIFKETARVIDTYVSELKLEELTTCQKGKKIQVLKTIQAHFEHYEKVGLKGSGKFGREFIGIKHLRDEINEIIGDTNKIIIFKLLSNEEQSSCKSFDKRHIFRMYRESIQKHIQELSSTQKENKSLKHQELLKKKNERYTCVCGVGVPKSNKSKHEKENKVHLKFLEGKSDDVASFMSSC